MGYYTNLVRYQTVKEIDQDRTTQRLVDFRESNGVSQVAVAEHVDCSPTYISKLEHRQKNWTEALIRAYIQAVKALMP